MPGSDEAKDDHENNNESLPNGFDSDDELDDKQGQQNDLPAVPLKNELGRDKINNSVPLPMFKKLFTSDIWAALKRFGGSPAPLSIIGTFLNYV